MVRHEGTSRSSSHFCTALSWVYPWIDSLIFSEGETKPLWWPPVAVQMLTVLLWPEAATCLPHSTFLGLWWKIASTEQYTFKDHSITLRSARTYSLVFLGDITPGINFNFRKQARTMDLAPKIMADGALEINRALEIVKNAWTDIKFHHVRKTQHYYSRATLNDLLDVICFML